MESTEVIIVGAGPAGLALALSLAKLEVKSVVLEKEPEITHDPRGVFLTHDACRILWNLGLGGEMYDVGYENCLANFHISSFSQKPFHQLDTRYDTCLQALPNGMFQIQPRLEAALRKKVNESPFCEVRCGCAVVSREDRGTSILAKYTNPTGQEQTIEGQFIIGADGKTGVIRKHFLEPEAGIQQVYSDYKYDGTWVAANLKINLPTPETHPEFPLWKLGFEPQEVYDLFWPIDWHFCSPPGKPTAAGRFGPIKERLWRHEFAQLDWNDSMDSVELLWDHILPMVTLKGDPKRGAWSCGEVQYPKECIEIRRCRPFSFTHKVVNKWFHNRTILIGDAAHVYPPFGGQGIASGLRDAHQLAWRLQLLLRVPKATRELEQDSLEAWSLERAQSVKDAAYFTSISGFLCNVGPTPLTRIWLTFEWLIRMIPWFSTLPGPLENIEERGFKTVKGGFYSTKFNGGKKMPQVYLSSGSSGPILSDTILHGSATAMTLLVLQRKGVVGDVAEARKVVRESGLDPSVLSENAIKVFSERPGVDTKQDSGVYYPRSADEVKKADIRVLPGYNGMQYVQRFTASTKFVVVRADSYVYGLANNAAELAGCLEELKERVQLA
ncbi:monooxygenase-like protein [Xylariaceae sp. FL0016]|nr:monooxygenase-like protein [Xylariaceae sp. FL0016]